MSRTLLDEYELWKRRQLAGAGSSIIDYFADGVRIGEMLLRIGCRKDREGMDIEEQVTILKMQLERMKELAKPTRPVLKPHGSKRSGDVNV